MLGNSCTIGGVDVFKYAPASPDSIAVAMQSQAKGFAVCHAGEHAGGMTGSPVTCLLPQLVANGSVSSCFNTCEDLSASVSSSAP